jgi:hypothetical protein
MPEQKQFNREINCQQIFIEHAFAALKTFKIISTHYLNRMRRLLLRFNLLVNLYNH